MTRKRLNRRINKILSVKSIADLAIVLNIPIHTLILQTNYKQYHEFSIPKRNGSRRHIEEPSPLLKDIQKRLNKYLQALYFRHKTSAAYGFIIDVKGTKDRTIVTNARQHLSASELMNIDMKDFFHKISKQKVFQIFRSKPFGYQAELAKLLTELCCYKSRLPMGSPTSPVLTNFYCIKMDQEISAMAKEKGIVYTRFVDDMSFSIKKGKLPTDWKNQVSEILHCHGLILNQEKTKVFHAGDTKIVTGILVSDRLDINPQLLLDTEDQIDTVRRVIQISGPNESNHPIWLKNHQQKIRGYLQFAKQILGQKDPRVKNLRQKYHKALHQPEWQGPLSWNDVPYFL